MQAGVLVNPSLTGGLLPLISGAGTVSAWNIGLSQDIESLITYLADRQVEGEWSSPGISQAVKLTAEPAPRAAKSSSMSPPFSARCRNVDANGGAIDAVVAAVRHDLRQRDRNGLPGPGFAPAPERR